MIGPTVEPAGPEDLWCRPTDPTTLYRTTDEERH